MPVTFDAVATTAQTLTSSFTIALTVANNAALLACFAVNSFTNSVSAVAYGAQAMTFLGESVVSAGSGLSVQLWGLANPTAGTANISANLAGGLPGLFQMVAASYKGAKASGPFGTVITGSLSAVTNANISLSSSTTDMGVVLWAAFQDIRATNGTERFHDATNFGYAVADIAGGAGAISLSATISGGVASNLCFIGVNIAFSPAAATAGLYTFGMLSAGL